MTQPQRLEKQYFFDQPVIDAILNSITGLTMEVSVLKERLDTVERIMDEQGSVSRDLIEHYEASPELSKQRMKERMELVQTVLDPFKDCFAAAARTDTSNSNSS